MSAGTRRRSATGKKRMRVPCVDLAAQVRPLKSAIYGALDACLARGDYILGEAVSAFEAAFARACGVREAVGVASGTDALALGLQAAGIGPGDEVITTAYTFIATAGAIALAGARPVLVDIDPRSYNLRPELVEAAITRRTRGILAVHLFGQPARMDTLLAIARRRRLAVFEDCAQAHGARYQGRPVGSFGDMAAFSFYPTKNLSALGDAGMIVTNRSRIATRARMLRDQGRQGKYRHLVIGRSSRMDTFQAAVLHRKLAWLAGWNRTRARLARLYTTLLRAHCPQVTTPSEQPGALHVYHLYVIRVADRDRVLAELNRRGIQALVHYPAPFHLQPAFRYLGYRRGDFPEAEQLTREAISLPLYPEMTGAQVRWVVRQLADIVRGA